MTQVAVADIAQDFGAQHAMRAVGLFAYIVAVDCYKIARPAATGIKLGVRGEQRGATAHAAIDAVFVVIPVASCKWPLGAFLARDIIFFRRKLGFPFGGSFDDFFHGDGSSANV